ncbi:dihydrolipoyl dehydrogenase [Aureimonas endophytica]|uniref:Dihydrolipoyl dehydrogenase n=1 Tax=Aureimonas endophytica TaxID=2027858 RepID=A0A917E8H2_9HYPH|nr:dihydrolipoyl dehydrogenase [Aureimonas endophytica]GGE15271.1 dihydrolipoyl dehydrogenase [Aureimonas endophytica]
MAELNCDVAVIGAGTAGRAAERSARRHGARTLLIDDGFAGTTCVRIGCMPSKLLIAAAEAAHAVRQAPIFGVETVPPRIDGRAVMARLRRERAAFLASDRESIESLPAGVALRGRARFAGPNRLALDDGRTVAAKAIVIATGSHSAVPENFASVADRVLTTETIFERGDLPGSLAVVGAGPIGLELAQAFARLGTDVMLFDKSGAIAGLKDRIVEADLRRILAREFPIVTGVDLTAERHGEAVRIAWHGEATGTRDFDHVLVAAGRPPNLAGLDLSAAGLKLDKHGVPVFDEATLQCGAAPIFIAGDANADRAVLHEASDEGTIAGRNAANFPRVRPGERGVPFQLTFTDPNVAVLGEVATEETPDVVIGTASYADQGRAKVMARNAGTVRFYAARQGGRLLGATMAGPGVEHMAHLVAWAIGDGRTAAELLDRPFYHPTFEEGLKSALRAICATSRTTVPSRDEARPSAA